jgi:hypothetical protein
MLFPLKMNKLTKRLYLAAATLVLAAAVAGCGGSSNAAPPLTKSEFTKAANTICSRVGQEMYEEISIFMERHNHDPTKGVVTPDTVQAVVVPHYQSQIDQIGELSPPDGDEKKIESYLTALQNAVDVGGEDPPPSEDRFEQLLKPSAQIAYGYGIDKCAYA